MSTKADNSHKTKPFTIYVTGRELWKEILLFDNELYFWKTKVQLMYKKERNYKLNYINMIYSYKKE
jgi:hypothetical protein